MRVLLGRVMSCAQRWVRGGLPLVAAGSLSMAVCACDPRGLQYCGVPESASAECERLTDPPLTTQTCELHAFDDSAAGFCVPYVDNGWHLGLFRMAHLPRSQLRCPPTAPNAGLVGEEIPFDRVVPRRVIGCSVNPVATCSSTAFACVPFEIEYPACISQDGPQDCPADYPDEIRVEKDGDGGEVTVCCRDAVDPG